MFVSYVAEGVLLDPIGRQLWKILHIIIGMY